MLEKRFLIAALQMINLESAKEKARTGDLDGAIEVLRMVVDHEFTSGGMVHRATAVIALVEALLKRGAGPDAAEAQAAIERLAVLPTEPRFVLYDVALLRLRALLARARGERPPTPTIGIATAPWRKRSASKYISPGPRRCHDGGCPVGCGDVFVHRC